MNNDKKALRYAARLTCIYDYCCPGDMDRSMNNMNKDDCMAALEALKSLPKTETIENLWSQVSREAPGVSHKDVADIVTWSIQGAYKYYEMQRREIEAVHCLRDLFADAGGNLFDIAERNNVYCWTLQGWLTFQKRITWHLVLAIEALKAEGKTFTIDDALGRMASIKQNFIEEQRMKK